jgi:mxaD protein
MNKLLLASLVLVGFMSNNALAGSTLKADESVEINAKASDVWAKVNNFGDWSVWHPAVKTTEIVEGKNNEKGAVRQLTLQDGGKIKEKLEAYNDAKQTYSYTILESVLPVSDYHSTITVKSLSADKTKVTWKGKFKAAGTSDDEAKKVISGVYRGGLDNLKKVSEAN